MEHSFWTVCVTHMFIEVYFLVHLALIPVFIREFQLGLFEVSFVATVPSLVALFMNLPSGFLADQFATKYLLFACMVTEGLSAFAISQTNSFWTLVLCVAVMRVASPIYHVSGLSLISRLVKQEKMSRSMGFHNAFGSLGSAIGLVSLAIFQSTADWRLIYRFWFLPIIAWGFIILRSPQLKTSESKKNEKERVLNRLPLIFSAGFLSFLVAAGLREVGSTSTSTFMTTYLVEMRGLSEAAASLIFGLGPFTGIAGSLSGGYLGEKVGAKKALDIAILGCVFSLSALALTAQFHLLTLVYLVYAFFSNSVWTPINTLVADLTPATERGLSFSAFFFTEGLIVSVTPTVAATIIGLADIWYIFPFNITFLTAGLIALQPLSYRRK